MFRRDSYDPIEKPRRIKDPRAFAEKPTDCCEICFARFGPFCPMEKHHIKSKGAGGSDTLQNRLCLCWLCHRKVHSGEISRETLVAIKKRGGGE